VKLPTVGKLACVGLLLPGWIEVEDRGTENPADPPLAWIDGEPVAAEGFVDWFVTAHGASYVDEYLKLVVLRREAARLGIAIAAADIDRALEEDWHRQVLMRFAGDESKFVAELASAGLTKDTRLFIQRPKVELATLAGRIVLHQRSPGDADLRKLYDEEFPGGIRRHLRVAFFRRFGAVAESESLSKEVAEARATMARERAEALAGTVRDEPASLPSLIVETDLLLFPRFDSMFDDLRERGGEIRRYRANHFNGDIDAAVSAEGVAAGQILGPIEAASGYYVVQVLALEKAPFDSVRDELIDFFRTRPPTPREIVFLQQSLLEKAEIRKSDYAAVLKKVVSDRR